MNKAVLERACAQAPFLALAATRQPDIADAFVQSDATAALTLAAKSNEASLRKQLRVKRERLALALALGDLAGELTLEQVCATLSAFADEALSLAIAHANERVQPQTGSAGFAAIALGKHGGGELNYSSDIDPIFLFDPDTLPRRPRDEPVEAAARAARLVVDLLQTRDADGYVFRVDLRLRPAAEITPPALPVNAAIGHYESSALAWERAAFVRARAAAGDVALGERFLRAVQPFVWRRSVDFGAIDDLMALSEAIRDHYAEGQRFGAGYDLKRGRGGIREIEFFVQIHQLIHGGRQPALRRGSTLQAIAALVAAGAIDGEQGRVLRDAYRLLRTIEHRLQMVDDRQTHSLPDDRDELTNVAQLHGLADGDALLALIEPHVTAVARLYDGLGDGRRAARPVSEAVRRFPPELLLEQRIARWRGGAVRALRTEAGRRAFDAVAPALFDGLAQAPEPGAALAAFEQLLERIPSGVNLFRLLDARRDLLGTLVSILAHAPTLAEMVGRQPALLDRLLDASAFDAPAAVAVLQRTMRAEGLEDTLDRVRQTVGEQRFALGVQIMEGRSDPLEAGQGYARLAEAAVATVAEATADAFAVRHGRMPGSELVVLALGRLGGGLLTNASDLDLIYLFTGDHLAESDGERPLGATLYYNRLAPRVSTNLSAPTAAGALYEVDTRLRPSGAQGPLAVSLDSFVRYQNEAAWTWEHMALTRARPVFGSAAARAQVEQAVGELLRRPRDPERLRGDVVHMQGVLHRHKPAAGPLDVKLVAGGLVDLEFAVHLQQLRHGVGVTPRLDAAIAELTAAGLLSSGLAEAHDLLTRALVTLRLVAPDLAEPAPARAAVVARACGFPDWPSLLAALDAARQDVLRAWNHVSGGSG